jgi:hypothetical protein
VSSHTMPRLARGFIRSASRIAVCLAVLSLAACESSHMLAPNQAAVSSGAAQSALVTLSCTVTFTAAHAVSTFKCGTPGQPQSLDMLAKGGARAAISPTSKARVTFGTQGVGVNLATSDFAYVGGIFSFDVTVQNLTAQPFGTTDGVDTTATGTRVVVTHGPTSAGGAGTVTVAADSGTMDLTAPGQPFWQYDAIIQPDSVSPPANWKFGVPATVTAITFVVEVTTDVPAEESVLRWLVLRQGMTDSTLYSAWQNTPTNIYAVGKGGSILNYNGSTWTTVAAGISGSQSLYGIFGLGASDIWVVGAAYTSHFDGFGWNPNANPGGTYYGVWGSSTSDVYAVGTGIIHRGTTWIAETNPTGVTLFSVWGADSSHVWAVGNGGTILFNPGSGTWTTQTSCTTSTLRSVWGSSATDVYAVGAGGAACHYDGTAWTAVSVGSSLYLEAVGGSSATDVWVASPTGHMSHFNGSTWTQLQTGVGTTLLGLTSGSASSIAVVGNHGTLLNYNGSTFVLSAQAGLPIYGVYATDSNNIYASSVGTILHYNGTSWTSAFAGAGDQFNAISGTSNTDIYAAGSAGTITHFNGTAWSSFFVGGSFRGIWDIPNQSTIYAVGAAGLIEKGSSPNAGSFTTQTSANAATLMAVWAVDAGNIFIVDSSGNIQNSNGSGTWTNEKSTGAALYAINGLEGVDQLTDGAGGAAWRLTGVTWASIPTTTTNTLRGIWDAFADDVYGVGDGGVIQHWNGLGWLAMASPVTTTLRAAYGTAQAHIYVGGDNGVILFGTR